jgi:chorismate synthase
VSHNTFGHLFRVTTWGESHGPAIGCVVDGCPPRIPLSEADLQPFLDRRRPGQSRFTTQRQEPDQVRILSGVFEGQTTGTPIALMIDNVDQRSKDYSNIARSFRPGHADLTYDLKYGIRDYRGGGRSSARETAMRVAAGAVARKVLGDAVVIRGAMVSMGALPVDRARWDWAAVEANDFFCPDPVAASAWDAALTEIRKEGSSIGAVIEIVAEGVLPGLGAPIYGKLDADLAAALMSINAVKGSRSGMASPPRRCAARRMRTKSGSGRTAAQSSSRTTPAGCWAAFPRDRLWSPASRSSRPARSSRRAARSTPRAGRPRSPPRAGTTPASASAPCR